MAQVPRASGIFFKGQGSCFLLCPAWDMEDKVAHLAGRGFCDFCFLLAQSLEAFPGPAQAWVQKICVRPEKGDEFVTRSIILDLIAWGKEAACSVLAAHFPLGLSAQEV